VRFGRWVDVDPGEAEVGVDLLGGEATVAADPVMREPARARFRADLRLGDAELASDLSRRQ